MSCITTSFVLLEGVTCVSKESTFLLILITPLLPTESHISCQGTPVMCGAKLQIYTEIKIFLYKWYFRKRCIGQ